MNFFSRFFKPNQKKLNSKELNISDFESVQSFWNYITQNNKWYLEIFPFQIKDIKQHVDELVPLIIVTTNNIRKEMNFTQDEYEKINYWDNLVYEVKMEDKLVQYCSNCNSEMLSMQRYPKAICNKCKNELKSHDGRKVEFYNSSPFGGCQGYYSGTNQKEVYNSENCYIRNKKFVAEEGRFGGIVIQLKE